MKWLHYNLWKAKQSLAPSRGFRRVLWRKLDNAWQERHGGVSWYRVHLVRLVSASTIGVVLAGSAATGAYAYTSADVTEGNILYPVKKTIETVEEKVQRTPEAKAQFYLKQIARREAEQKVLERRRQKVVHVEEQIDQVENKLEATKELIASTTLNSNPDLKEKIKERLEKRRARFENRKNILEDHLQKIKSATTSTKADHNQIFRERQRERIKNSED